MPELLTIEPRDGLGIASVMARKAGDFVAIGARLGVELPAGPRAAAAGNRTVIGTGPAAWLVLEENADSDFAEALQERLAGLASVSDQSSGYRVLRLSGASARTALQRGAAIDFHPHSFGPGSAAITVIAHIGVVLWQLDEGPTYDVATFRSYAASFDHWLGDVAATL